MGDSSPATIPCQPASQLAAVLAWPRGLDGRGLRRLQLAAEAGRSLGLLFRPLAARREASSAFLRLMLEGEEATLKRFRLRPNDQVLLIPENPALKPMAYDPARIAIQGVLIAKLRLYR